MMEDNKDIITKMDFADAEARISHRENRSQQSNDSSPVSPDVPYAEQGALINRRETVDREWAGKASNASLMWPRIRHLLRRPFSEFMGTFILIMFGDGVVAQVVLSNDTKGNYQSINWGWGLGVLLGVYASGISGAHINPAVTFANCVFRKFPWRELPGYVFAQTLGAFLASGVVYANYKGAINVFEGGQDIRTVSGPTATAGIFCTYPVSFLGTTGMFFDEIIGSALLMFLIYALKDDSNLGAGPLTPWALMFVVFGIGACFGWQTGYAINPARDFGPRLMSAAVGYGSEVWTAGNYYFWIPIVAPVIGTTLGGFLYDAFLFTGESPINTPYMGLYRFLPGVDNSKLDGERWRPEQRKLEDSNEA